MGPPMSDLEFKYAQLHNSKKSAPGPQWRQSKKMEVEYKLDLYMADTISKLLVLLVREAQTCCCCLPTTSCSIEVV